MSEDYKIEIPIDMQGEGGGNKEMANLNKNVSKLDKTMYMTLDVIEMLSTIADDLFKLLQPIFKILSVLFMIIFLPLLPLIKLLVNGLAFLVKVFTGEYGDIGEMIGKLVVGIILAALAIIVIALVGWGIMAVVLLTAAIVLFVGFFIKGAKLFWENLKKLGRVLLDAGMWIWNSVIKPVWNWLGNLFLTIWTDYIEPAWNFLKDVGKWIWEQILKPAWNFLKDVGKWIWDILKAPFEWVARQIRRIPIIGGKSTSVTDAIIRPDGSVIKTDPADYLIATKTPEKLGGTGTTININHPTVREDRDIKKIADEVSKQLERNLWRK